MWRFDIAHLPGSTNTAAGAASRHPATSEFFATISGAERDSIDSLEEALLASLQQNTLDELTLNWDEIARHTASDVALNDLLSAIQSNFDVNLPPEGGIRQSSHIAMGFTYLTALFYTMIVLRFRRNSAIKYYAHCMPLIKGCRPWNGERAQPFSGRGLKIFTIFAILVLTATEMRRRKPQPPRCLPTRLPRPSKKFLRIILITRDGTS